MIPTTLAPLTARAARFTLTAVVGISLLAGCGGGTSQVEAFVPDRILTFGDELSLLTAEGKKYGTNFVDDTNVLKCNSSPIWIQTLAARYGMVYSQCNPDNVATAKARTLAVNGATVDGMATQIQGFLAGDSIQGQDLVTVLIGMHDILDAYASYPTESEAILTARLQSAGARAAAQVNALAAAGARVLVSTAPDVGLTPFAVAENTLHGDGRSAVMTRLTNAFNRSMRLELTNDGSRIGLLLMDDLLRSMSRVPAYYGIADTKNAVCAATVSLPDCSNKTLIPATTVPTPTIVSYLWADATRPAATVHSQLGAQAVTRAANNPF